MKRILVLVLVFVGVALFVKAQGKFEIHAGGAFPTSEFASTDVNGGGAANGYNVGAKYYYPLSKVDGLSLTLGLDFLNNGINQSAKDMTVKSFEGAGVTNLKIANWDYINVPLLAGLDYKYNVNKSMALFGDIALGVNYSKQTDLIITFDYQSIPVKGTMSLDPLTNIAFQFGGGILIDNQYSIGLHYFGLGNYKYKGPMTIETMGPVSYTHLTLPTNREV